jgi:cytochrome P450
MELLDGVQAVHHTWKAPDSWRPQRFMPGGEYDSFDEDIRQYMVGTRIGLFCQVHNECMLALFGKPVWPCIQLLSRRHVALQFVPFIQGPRNCLGQFFALLEARVVLALLVKVRHLIS